MPAIVVIDLSHVTVDGVQAGSVTDVLINYASVEGIRGELLAALGTWHETCQQCHSDQCKEMQDAHQVQLGELASAHAAELASRDAQHAAEITALNEHHALVLADAESKHESAIEAIKAKNATDDSELYRRLQQHEATIADQASQIAALGGTELGQRLAREARLKAAQDDLAKAQADLAAAAGGDNAMRLVAKNGESKSFSGWAFTSEGVVDLTGQGRTFSPEGDDDTPAVTP